MPLTLCWDAGIRPGGVFEVSGALRCWGSSNMISRYSPPPDLGPVAAVAAGGEHTCAVNAVSGLGLGDVYKRQLLGRGR